MLRVVMMTIIMMIKYPYTSKLGDILGSGHEIEAGKRSVVGIDKARTKRRNDHRSLVVPFQILKVQLIMTQLDDGISSLITHVRHHRAVDSITPVWVR